MLTEKASNNAIIQVHHPETAKAGNRVKIECTITAKNAGVEIRNILVDLKLGNDTEMLRLQSILPPPKDQPVRFTLETPEIHSSIDVSLSIKMDSQLGVIEEEIRSRILVKASEEPVYGKRKPSIALNLDLFEIIKRNPSIPLLIIFGALVIRSIMYYYDYQPTLSEAFARYSYYVLFVAIALVLIKQFLHRKRSDPNAN